NKFNQDVASGQKQAHETAIQIQALAKKVGFEGDLWGNGSIKSTSAAPAKSDLSDSSTLGELGKAAWNGLLDTATGIARTPQILHDAAGALNTAVFGEQDAGAKADSERINKVFKGLGDAVAHFVDKGKADLDASGAFDQGLFSKDDSGDWHYNSIQGAAHSIGQSLGFLASMIGPGLVGKGAKAIGIGTSALRAAKAAGDVERVAELTRAAQGTERAMRFVGGVTSQVEPLYQDALEATGDSHKAAAFTAAVAPVVAAIDAFTGVESLAAGGAGRQLSKELVKQVIGRMSGEVTEETLKPLVKTFAEQWVKGRMKEGMTQFAVEVGTEGVQESYQMLIEKLFDKAAGNTKLADQGGAADARLINSIALGGLVGGPMGAILHHNGTYHPTAFKVLQDAYLDGGKEGLDGAVSSLQNGLTKWGSADAEQQGVLRNQVNRMASVISSFKNPYQVDPKTQFQYYDVAYNQLPDQQNQLAQLQAQHDALTSDQPTVTDIDENGQPVTTPVDPIVAANLASQLAPELADQQRRVKYLSDVQNRLTSQGKYQDWAKGYDVIGKYQPGDRIVGSNLDDRSDVDGTVTNISEDGQTLTVEVPPVQSGDQPTSVQVRALDARPFEQSIPRTADQNPDVAEAEVGDVSVGDNLADGFVSHQLDETGNHREYTTGQRVVLADDPTKSYPVETDIDAEGNQTLTIAHPDGPITGTLDELTDKSNPRRILGTYSPEQALARQDWKQAMRRNEETSNKLKAKLPAATVTALDAMSEGQLQSRYEQLGKNKADSDERKYIELLAERNNWPVTAPEASPASQREHTQDALAADTPTQIEPILDAGEEVIDDSIWNQIIDSDQIPNEVIADIAARQLSGQSLTDRQQILFDGFDQTDESVYMASLDELTTQVLNAKESPTNEPVQPAQINTNPDTAGSPGGSTGEDSQDGQGGSPESGTQTVPGSDGSVSTQLANAPTAEPAGTGSPAVEAATSSTPGPYQNGSAPIASLDYPSSFDAYGVVTPNGVTISDKPNPNTVVGLVKTEKGYIGYIIRKGDGGRIGRAYTYRDSMINPSFNDTISPRPDVTQDIQTLSPAEYTFTGKLVKKGEVFYQKDDALYNPATAPKTPVEEATKADGDKLVQQSLATQQAVEAHKSQQATTLADALGVDPEEVADVPDQSTSLPVYQAGPQPEGIATVGTQVRVLLSGGTETLGVIRGKNAEGDIIVRRMNRKGTAEEDFPHPASAILAVSGKPISIDENLPAPAEEEAQAAATVKPGQQMMAPGTSGGQVLVDVLSVGDDGNAKVRVVLSNVERTVPVSKLSEPPAAEITRVKKILSERKGVVRKQVAVPEDVAIPRTPPQVLIDWINKLRKAFPRVKIETLSNSQMVERFGEADRGAVENGIVYINLDTATADTPLHEYAHIYNTVLRKYFPQLYQRGHQLIDGSVYIDQVRASHPHLKNEEAIREEALATAIAEKGVSLSSLTIIQRFKTWAGLMMHRIGEAVGFPLSMESTLDDYLTARARELTSGRTLSMNTSDDLAQEGVQSQKAQRPTQATVLLPSVMDEAWLAANGDLLTENQYQDIVDNYQQVYNPATGAYSQQKVDIADELNTIRQVQDKFDRNGGLATWLRTHANLLDHSNLGLLVYGESLLGIQYQNILQQQLEIVAPMKTAGYHAFKQFYILLKGRTVFRGAMTWNTAEKWDITGLVENQPVRLQVPVDQVVHMAAQYRSTIKSKGHFDPKHAQKMAQGIEPTMGFKLPNVDNPDAPIFVRLNKTELRALEDRVFIHDAGTIALMQAWSDHSNRMFPSIARIHRLMTGKTLAQLADYFPLSPVSMEADIMARSIDKFVDDAGLLKGRDEGASEWVSADGFLSAANRYQREAENFVQLSPLWQNLKGLAARQQSHLAGRGLASITDALNRQAKGYQMPDAVHKANTIKLVGTYDIGKLLRLATLSRFAFNIAIPLKQITGFVSAFGSGAIDAKYLRDAAPLYFKMIGESYVLVGRGDQGGGYFGNPTDFDEINAELATIDTPDSHVLRWRMQGQTHPDIRFDDWSSKRDVAGYVNQTKNKLRSFFEEYGLSISQRADTAVVGALYRAAKAQVVANNPDFSEQQIRQEAATRAKEALYYSNQTFDRTDRASIQFANNPVEQLLLLYKGQGVKIFNTMARRTIELAQAPDPAKKAARLRLAYNLGLNAVLAPLITTAVDVGVLALRNLIKDDKEKANDKEEEHSEYLDYGMTYLSSILSQLFPAELGDATAAIAYMASNPSSKREFFNVNPIGVVADLFNSVGELIVDVTSKTYSSERAFQQEVTKAVQNALRAGAVRAGVPMEAVRQINHLIGNWLLPEPKPKARSRTHRHHTHRRDQDANYGLEYLTGTEEETIHHRRR
ncbi:hypothetical protein, partial [Spirosoma arboris]|uniref:hypothetical protein n=1 Tax=Spirosoma arboris TaxID=2682092 RepID=UPI0018DC3155